MPVGATELRRITSVQALPGYRLHVAWQDAPPITISLADDVQKGGIFRTLADEEKFAKVRIADEGYLIEWPEPADDDGRPIVDIDADALFVLGLQQHVQHHTDGLVQRIFRSFFRTPSTVQ